MNIFDVPHSEQKGVTIIVKLYIAAHLLLVALLESLAMMWQYLLKMQQGLMLAILFSVELSRNQAMKTLNSVLVWAL